MENTIVIGFLLLLLVFAGCVSFSSRQSVTPSQTTSRGFDVREFGAQGDGMTDDTQAFQDTLDRCAESGGGVVSVPAGKYLIKTNILVPPSVTLEGTWRAPSSVDRYHRVPQEPDKGPELQGSVLLAVENPGLEDATAFIRLERNATLKGVTIFYPHQTKTNPPVAYPWTVATVGADNCSIIDVLMVNPYQAVDFGNRASGRHYIRSLYAQPLRRGIYVDHCLDVGRLENIHLWPFWTAADPDSPVGRFMLEQGEAFIFGRSDWEYVSNCFAIAYKIGFRFIKGKGEGPFAGGGNYLLSQSGADMCDMAVLAEDIQAHSGVSFSNSQIFGDIITQETNHGMLRFSSCGLFGSISGRNGVGLARIAGRGRVSFDNCHFYAIDRRIETDRLIHVVEGRVSITDSVFINSWDAPYNHQPIVLERPVRAAIITNNEFYGRAGIVNNAIGRVVIEGNVENTDIEPFPNKGEEVK